MRPPPEDEIILHASGTEDDPGLLATRSGRDPMAEKRHPGRLHAMSSDQDEQWYQQVVDQTVAASLLKRYGSMQGQATVILFLV